MLKYFQRFLRETGPLEFQTRTWVGPCSRLFYGFSIILLFTSIYSTFTTQNFAPSSTFKVLGGYLGALFLMRRAGRLWRANRLIHETEREIQLNEVGFQKHELEKLAKEINDIFYNVFFLEME